MRVDRRAGLIGLFLMAVLLLALPVGAQDSSSAFTVVFGEALFNEHGDMVVDGFIIAPANGFSPPTVSLGDEVIVTGVLLDDGVTIRAVSLEFFDATEFATSTNPGDATDAVDDSSGSGRGNRGQGRGNRGGDDEASGSGKGRGNRGDDEASGSGRGNRGQGRGNRGGDDEASGSGNRGQGRGNNNADNAQGRGNSANAGGGSFCQTGENHPAAIQFAGRFENADAGEISALFCNTDFGFGEIMLAFQLAEATGDSAQTFLTARTNGQGWGQIFRDSDVSPSDFAPGRGRGRGNSNGSSGG